MGQQYGYSHKKNADPAKSKIVKKVNGVRCKEPGGMKINVSWKVQRSVIRYEIQIATDKRFKKNLVKKLFLKDDDNLTIKYKKSGNAYVRAYDKYGYVGGAMYSL